MASPFQALVKAKAKVKPQTDTFTVEYPCLVNTAVIQAGKEVILKWDQKKEEKAGTNNKERTAFDQLVKADGQERKAKKAKTHGA